ncbi:MAG: S41 family peptidase [Candidatus Latescibacteria bacterium]|nr:S41 family peptidase [Candidatus Latescibacterota bacterium]
MKRLMLSLLLAGALALPWPTWGAENDPYAEVNASWDRFGDVYLHILENYYTHLDQTKVMRSAIEGMIKDLDPYSQFFDQEGLRQLRQDTTGKFAGLGITVGIKDGFPVIIVPIEETPAERAGLLPGDQLVEIDGKSTKGSSLDDIVAMLRGEPGSRVQLKVHRYGHEDWVQSLDREIIKIRSVTLTELLAGDIGYISMKQTRFSEDTADEVAESLRKLKEAGAQGVILDLRGNPGGLLSQAVGVAELVLPKGAPVVTIKERDNKKEEKKTASGHSISEVLPLIVLIDEGSASAAEIVAGAIQDNDRGVILGTTSFGKGSVQTIFDLHEADESALKLTTALYYTPSGRCIHRLSHSSDRNLLLKVPFGEVELPVAGVLEILMKSADALQAAGELKSRFDLEDSVVAQILAEPLASLVGQPRKYVADAAQVKPVRPDGDPRGDTAASRKAEAEVYHTRKGRPVYGGGGITPDLVSEPPALPSVVRELQKERLFFDFAIEYVGQDTAMSTLKMAPEVDAPMLAAFETFVRSRSATRDSTISEGIAKKRVAELRRLGDELNWNPETMADIDRLEQALAAEKSKGIINPVTEPYIREAIRRDLILRLQGKKASLIAELESDVQVNQAIALLKEPQRYSQYLVVASSKEQKGK